MPFGGIKHENVNWWLLDLTKKSSSRLLSM